MLLTFLPRSLNADSCSATQHHTWHPLGIKTFPVWSLIMLSFFFQGQAYVPAYLSVWNILSCFLSYIYSGRGSQTLPSPRSSNFLWQQIIPSLGPPRALGAWTLSHYAKSILHFAHLLPPINCKLHVGWDWFLFFFVFLESDLVKADGKYLINI